MNLSKERNLERRMFSAQENGYYIYEVDGNFPTVPAGDFEIKRNMKVVVRKLVPVKKKEVLIKVKK
jgi:hypothetical protein